MTAVVPDNWQFSPGAGDRSVHKRTEACLTCAGRGFVPEPFSGGADGVLRCRGCGGTGRGPGEGPVSGTGMREENRRLRMELLDVHVTLGNLAGLFDDKMPDWLTYRLVEVSRRCREALEVVGEDHFMMRAVALPPVPPGEQPPF